MTNEEASKLIQDFLGWFKEDSDIHKALELAIKALSSWEKYSDKLWETAYERGKAETKDE